MPRWGDGGLLAALLFLNMLSPGVAGEPLVKLEIDGQPLEGRALFTSANFGAVMARDGRMWQFDPNSVSNLRATTSQFRGYSVVAMRSQLRREFDKRFEISATGHYLVVHPRGNGRQWSGRFEDLYRSFRHYFSVRGFRLSQPDFPLVAVIMPSQSDFLRYANRQGDRPRAGSPGYYSTTSNRVVMYDQSSGQGKQDWSKNAELVIHEATHQTAFNTGIHTRLAPTPRWVTEGLGTLFEAEGVWNARNNHSAGARVNREQLRRFREYAATRRKSDVIAELVSYDRMFPSDAWAAYAQAWALTYYLAESQPRKYAKYLRLTAQRPEFQDYRAAERLEDFTSVFGKNLKLFDAQFLRYMKRVK